MTREQTGGHAGSKNRAPNHVELKAGPIFAHSRLIGRLSIISYPERLLRVAQRLFNEEEYGVEVVVAHMACEIATERLLGEAFRVQNRNGYNLGNDKVLEEYISMTGDAIHEQRFWPAFRKSARRRNKIIHTGKTTSRSEAEESLEATSKLIAHLMK